MVVLVMEEEVAAVAVEVLPEAKMAVCVTWWSRGRGSGSDTSGERWWYRW